MDIMAKYGTFDEQYDDYSIRYGVIKGIITFIENE